MAGYKVRAAEPGDCEEIIRMIQELAEYEKMSDGMTNTVEGKGIGSKLLVATAEMCLSLGCACMLLSVHNWNQSAISLYQSCGGRNMSDEEGWRTFRFLPDDLQQMISKNAKRAGDPGLP